MSGIDKFLGWLADLRSQRAQLESKLRKLQDERAQMLSAPPCEADMIATFDAYLACCETYFEAQVGRIANEFLTNRPFWKPDAYEGADATKGRFGKLPLLNRAGQPHAMCILTAGAIAGPMREAVTAAVKRLKLAKGPTLEERRARIGDVDKEIAALESDLQAIKEQAARVARESTQ